MSSKKSQLYLQQTQGLGEAIRRKREETGLKGWEFSAKYGISPHKWQTWELGRTPPPIDDAINMLRALASILPEVRMKIGALLDALRGSPTGKAGRAFEALEVILRHAPETKQESVLEMLEEAAAKYKR